MIDLDQRTLEGYKRVAAVEVAVATLAGRALTLQEAMGRNLFLATTDTDPKARRNATGTVLRSMLPFSSFGTDSLIPMSLVDGKLMVGATPDHSTLAVENLTHAVTVAGFDVDDVYVQNRAQQDVEDELRSFRAPSPERIGDYAALFAQDPEEGGDILSRLLEDIWAEALDLGASDVDLIFQPESDKNWIAYHVHGERDLRHNINDVTMGSLVALVKQLAGCQDHAVRDKIQSGRLSIAWQGRTIDGRVGTGPIEPDGEEVSIRLLDLAKLPPFRVLIRHMPEVEAPARAMIRSPGKASGLVIVSGPTGQGKTTTLASFEAAFDRVRKKIIEVSAPPEYLVPYVLTENATGREGRRVVDHIAGALRRAPDILVVQEVRTEAEGDAAAQAVNSGHLTFLTLHAGDAPQTVQRFVERLGDDYQRVAHAIVGEHLRLVINQRLVPRLCHACRQPAGEVRAARHGFSAPDLTKRLEIKHTTLVFQQSEHGCSFCRRTGIGGLALAAETLVLPRAPEYKANIIGIIQERRFDDLRSAPGVVYVPRVRRIGQLLAEGLIGVDMAKDFMAVG